MQFTQLKQKAPQTPNITFLRKIFVPNYFRSNIKGGAHHRYSIPMHRGLG